MRALYLLPLGIVYLIFAALYMGATPYRSPGVLMGQRMAGVPLQVPDIGAPDERAHANYVSSLLKGEGFPVLRPGSKDISENYQSHQPPLYYVVAAGFSWLFAIDPADADGAALRWLSVLFGLGTVAGVFFCVLWGLDRQDIALGASVFAALFPSMLALNSAVSNDPALFCFATWSFALGCRIIRYGLSVALVAGAAALAGLAMLTKTSALSVLPVVLAAVWLAKGAPGERLKYAGLALVTAIAIPLGWWLRNQSLYGDPLAMNVFRAAFEGSPKATAFIAAYGETTYWLHWVGWWTARSLVGVFGYTDIFLPEKLYRLALAFIALCAGGLVFYRKRDETLTDGIGRQVVLLGALFLLMVALLFVSFNATYFQAQVRYLFPAIAPLSLFLALGLRCLSRNRPWVCWALPAGLLIALNIYVLIRLPDEFERRTIVVRAMSLHAPSSPVVRI